MTISAATLRPLGELDRLSRRGLDSGAFRRQALGRIRRLVPVDAAWFATADPATLLFTSAMMDDVLRPHAAQFLHNEFLVEDVNHFRSLAGSGRIASTLDLQTEG